MNASPTDSLCKYPVWNIPFGTHWISVGRKARKWHGWVLLSTSYYTDSLRVAPTLIFCTCRGYKMSFGYPKIWAMGKSWGGAYLTSEMPRGKEGFAKLACCHGTPVQMPVLSSPTFGLGLTVLNSVSSVPTAVTVSTGHKRQTVGGITERRTSHWCFYNARGPNSACSKWSGENA